MGNDLKGAGGIPIAVRVGRAEAGLTNPCHTKMGAGGRFMSQVQGFYDSHVQYEWERLERHPMEFAITMKALAEHLPTPPCTVLDVGGGPGRYAIALTRQGYRVTLFDLSANCLEFARRKVLEAGLTLGGIVHGNALDLGVFADRSFDAVLLMGPMYHLLSPEDRARSLAEAHRVMKPGGVLGVAFINRYATILTHQPQWVVSNLKPVREEVKTGIRGTDGRFTASFSIHPAEVPLLCAHAGFAYVEMVAGEGIAAHTEGEASQLTGTDWQEWVELNYQLARDPALHGAAVHLFAVARKE